MTHTEHTGHDTGMAAPSQQPEPPTPEERLSRSRASLHAWFNETYPQEAAAKEAGRAPTSLRGAGEPTWLTAIFDMLSDVPAATVAARWLRRWWARHPWRATADLALAITREVAEPAARRHRWLLVGGALLAGVAISRVRPWRWISGGAILASMVPRVEMGAMLHWFTATMSDLVAKQQARHAAASRPETENTAPFEESVTPASPAVEHFPVPGSSSLH